MLVDVTRRPVRLIPDECPTLVVIRTMSLRGRADGLLHHERDKEREKALRRKGLPCPTVKATVQPKVTVPNGESAFLETILVPEVGAETYTISAYQDQVTKTRSTWRINFLVDEAKGGVRILTLLDETNSAMLFTVQVPEEAKTANILFNVTTPLRRFLNNQQIGERAGLWGAVIGDEDF